MSKFQLNYINIIRFNIYYYSPWVRQTYNLNMKILVGALAVFFSVQSVASNVINLHRSETNPNEFVYVSGNTGQKYTVSQYNRTSDTDKHVGHWIMNKAPEPSEHPHEETGELGEVPTQDAPEDHIVPEPNEENQGHGEEIDEVTEAPTQDVPEDHIVPEPNEENQGHGEEIGDITEVSTQDVPVDHIVPEPNEENQGHGEEIDEVTEVPTQDVPEDHIVPEPYEENQGHGEEIDEVTEAPTQDIPEDHIVPEPYEENEGHEEETVEVTEGSTQNQYVPVTAEPEHHDIPEEKPDNGVDIGELPTGDNNDHDIETPSVPEIGPNEDVPVGSGDSGTDTRPDDDAADTDYISDSILLPTIDEDDIFQQSEDNKNVESAVPIPGIQITQGQFQDEKIETELGEIGVEDWKLSDDSLPEVTSNADRQKVYQEAVGQLVEALKEIEKMKYLEGRNYGCTISPTLDVENISESDVTVVIVRKGNLAIRVYRICPPRPRVS